MTINATIALIRKDKPGFPVVSGEFPIDSEFLWKYFNDESDDLDRAIKQAAKVFLGVPEKSPVYLGVYCDYIVNPATQEVETGPAAFGLREFWSDIAKRQSWFASRAKEGKK